MSNDVVYALYLAAQWLLIAAVPLLLLRSLLRRQRVEVAPPERPAQLAPAATQAPAPAQLAPGKEPGTRRCRSCGSRWFGMPGSDRSRVVVLLARRTRRRTRAAGRPVPDWAVRQGWSRCPSCASTQVRASGSELASR